MSAPTAAPQVSETMAHSVKGVLLNIVSEKCYDEYFTKMNFFDGPCFKASLSKGLGIGIIAGSILVKVPQILKIINSKSAKGINFFGVFLELFAVTASVAYSYIKGFPFSAWGEGTFLALQTASIAALVLHYGGSSARALLFLSVYAGATAALVSGSTPPEVLWGLQASNVPIVLAGKMIQAHTNYKNGSTGQLSAATCLLLFVGSLMRIFTSIQETGDITLVLTYCASSFANGIIVMQLVWYWNSDKSKKKDKKKKK